MTRFPLRGLAACLCVLPLVAVVLAASGCSSAPEKPAKSAGYYDGPMTPAGGGKTAKKSAGDQ